jgi:hypothetical protein
VKTIYISGNFIAIENITLLNGMMLKMPAEQINTFVSNGGTIITIDENKTKKQPITVYGDNSNPAALKFVVSRMLTKEPIEFKSIDDTAASPLAQKLFKFSYVKGFYR